jgi:hypothetical protein
MGSLRTLKKEAKQKYKIEVKAIEPAATTAGNFAPSYSPFSSSFSYTWRSLVSTLPASCSEFTPKHQKGFFYANKRKPGPPLEWETPHRSAKELAKKKITRKISRVSRKVNRKK